MDYKKITKIQYKKDKMEIKWLQNAPTGHTDEKSIKSKTEPHEDFVRAFRALDKSLCKEAELPQNEDEYLRHDIQVLHLDYDTDEQGNDVLFASIVSERFVATAEDTMTIASPMKPESKSLGEPLLDSKSVEAIDKVIQEAVQYLEGKRYDLFSQNTEQMLSEAQIEVMKDD